RDRKFHRPLGQRQSDGNSEAIDHLVDIVDVDAQRLAARQFLARLEPALIGRGREITKYRQTEGRSRGDLVLHLLDAHDAEIQLPRCPLSKSVYCAASASPKS